MDLDNIRKGTVLINVITGTRAVVRHTAGEGTIKTSIFVTEEGQHGGYELSLYDIYTDWAIGNDMMHILYGIEDVELEC